MSGLHINGKLEIATGIPATMDKVGFETLFTASGLDIGDLIEAPVFATTHSDISINLLSGRNRIRKGAVAGVASALSYSQETDLTDAGQAAVKAACAARGEYSLRWTPDGSTTTQYCSGILKDYVSNKPTNASSMGASCTFVPNYDAIEVTIP